MKTKPSLGTGLAGVFAHAVAAGIIASSSGSASAACAPFRNVLLGIAFFVMIIVFAPQSAILNPQSSIRIPQLKRRALHDAQDQRRKAIVVLASLAQDRADGGRVVVLDASS